MPLEGVMPWLVGGLLIAFPIFLVYSLVLSLKLDAREARVAQLEGELKWCMDWMTQLRAERAAAVANAEALADECAGLRRCIADRTNAAIASADLVEQLHTERDALRRELEKKQASRAGRKAHSADTIAQVQWLLNLGLSRRQVAKELKISRTSVNHIANGEHAAFRRADPPNPPAPETVA